MKFLDKIKDLFSDEEEVIETKEIEVDEMEEEEEHKLPTFMRNKIEEEQKREEEKKQREIENQEPLLVSDREMIRTRSNNNFSFPMDMDEPSPAPVVQRPAVYSNTTSQNVLQREKKQPDN